LKIEETLGSVSSLSYSTELIDKTYSLPVKIKDLLTLLNNNNSYQDKGTMILELQIINNLRIEIIDYLLCICYNLNSPEILGNNMIKIYVTPRFGWAGRGLEKRDHRKKMTSSVGVIKLKI